MGKHKKTFESPRHIQAHQRRPALGDNIIQSSRRFLRNSSSGLKKVQKNWFSNIQFQHLKTRLQNLGHKIKNKARKIWFAKKTQILITKAKRNLIYSSLMIKRYAQRYWRRFKFYLHVKTTPKNANKAFIKSLNKLESQNKNSKKQIKDSTIYAKRLQKLLNCLGKMGKLYLNLPKRPDLGKGLVKIISKESFAPTRLPILDHDSNKGIL